MLAASLNQEEILYLGNINRDDALELMVDYLGVNPEAKMTEFEATRGARSRFRFLEKVYTNELLKVVSVVGDDEQVTPHRAYATKAYMLYLVGTTIFMDNGVNYVDVIYQQNFDDFEWIQEYNSGRLFGLLVLQVI